MEKEEEELEEIREALSSLVSKVKKLMEKREKREDKNWKDVVQDFVKEADRGITAIVDVSGSMLANAHLIEAFQQEMIETRRDTQLIHFSDRIEMYHAHPWGKTPSIQSIGGYGGSSDLLQVFKWIERNKMESPLIVFSDGVLEPDPRDMDYPELNQILDSYGHPILWIFPSKSGCERDRDLINPVIERFKRAYMK